MFITYRRTGGVLALLSLVAVGLAATVLTAAVAATLLIVALPIAAAFVLARRVLPAAWRRRHVAQGASGTGETLEGTVVDSTVVHDDGRPSHGRRPPMID